MLKHRKKIAALLCGIMLGTGVMAPAAHAMKTWQKLVLGAAAVAYIAHEVTKMDNTQQLQFIGACKAQTGVYEGAEANARVYDVFQNFTDTGAVERQYYVYVSPDEDINAFMSLGGVMCVNKGTLDAMDDDELAYIMAHELVHGEERHSLSGVKKKVGLATAVSIYTAGAGVGGALLGAIATNYVSNAVFTKDQEKIADDLGFQYLVDAGYNPGAAAAAMQVLYDRYGDRVRTGLTSVIAPASHPVVSERVRKNVKRMKEYSGDHVNVEDDYVVVNGEKTFQPAAAGKYTQKERTFLVAGKLAKLYHAGHVPDTVFEDNVISAGNVEIYSVEGNEDGLAISKALNKGIAKDRGKPVEKKSKIDKKREKLIKKAQKEAEKEKKEQEKAAAETGESHTIDLTAAEK